ncbi:MAG: hypothetical protein ACOCUI_02800, partial [bacterium]
MWRFEKTNFIKEKLFNALLRRFYEYGLPGLVRENIQNSLDAHIPDLQEPVIVTIKTGEIKADEIPGHNEIIEHIKSLHPNSSYTKEAIDEMKMHINKQTYNYISFEDENTIGLSGSKYEDIIGGSTPYTAYAYSKGAHHVLKDEELEQSRGGSHGVGKIASNSASNFNTMFFSNCDENGYQTLGGTIELMEHEYSGNSYRATGYFSKEKNDFYYPYENIGFNKVFKKETRGLKNVVPYLRKQFLNEKEIIKNVIDSFLLAI